MRCYILSLCIVFCCNFVVSELNSSQIELLCRECTSISGNRFLKTIWFPIAPLEYLCVNSTNFISKYALVLEFICREQDCKNVHDKKPTKYWDVNNLNCSCKFEESVNEPRSNHGEDIILLLILLVILFLSGESE
jgi:hypothetical protein